MTPRRKVVVEPVAVLLVEDDPAAAELLARCLAESDLDVAVERVDGLVPALDRLAESEVAVCLLDLDLPDSSGAPTLLAVRMQAPGVPVLVLADSDADEASSRALSNGASGRVITPAVEPDTLAGAIRAVLEAGPGDAGPEASQPAGPPSGVLDPQTFAAAGAGQARIAAIARRPFALLYLDVDGLGGLNERLGREVGDRLLAELSALLAGSFRASDFVARVGDDEFCVLLPGSIDADGVERALARLRERMDEANERHEPAMRLSLTIGTARFDPAVPVAFEELVHRAQRDMLGRKLRALAASL